MPQRRQRTMSHLASIATAARPPRVDERLRLGLDDGRDHHGARRAVARSPDARAHRKRSPRSSGWSTGAPKAASRTPSSAASTRGRTGLPLGELRSPAEPPRTSPSPLHGTKTRASLHVDGRRAHRRRDALPAVRPGDLLQAGPLLVRGEPRRLSRRRRPRGLLRRPRTSSTPTSPPSATRARRSGSARGELIAVVGDGRAARDAGLTIGELAEAMAEARRALRR